MEGEPGRLIPVATRLNLEPQHWEHVGGRSLSGIVEGSRESSYSDLSMQMIYSARLHRRDIASPRYSPICEASLEERLERTVTFPKNERETHANR